MITTPNQIKIQYLIKKLRRKYDGDEVHTKALDRIIWYSYPIVYPNENSQRAIQRAMDTRKRKKNRTNQKIKEMMQCYDMLYFLTLTFTDDVINGTKESTRHKYVQRWLNENCRDYFANQDFGKKNGREHYHAVVALNVDKKNIAEWQYGFSKIKPISFDDHTAQRCSSYLLKLTNHAGKLGTGKSFSKRGLKEVDNLPF